VAYVVNVTSGHQSVDGLRESLEEILASRSLLVLATVGTDSGPHANTGFFAYDDDLVVFFVSERSTRHSQNLGDDPRVMAAVFLDPPVYGEHLRGLQLAGRAAEASLDETPHALAVYRKRFPTFAQDPAVQDRFCRAEGPAVLYRFTVDGVTVIDEPRFGRRKYITATITR
jgi:uncharacterized protein